MLLDIHQGAVNETTERSDRGGVDAAGADLGVHAVYQRTGVPKPIQHLRVAGVVGIWHVEQLEVFEDVRLEASLDGVEAAT